MKPISKKHQAFITAYTTNGFKASEAYKTVYPNSTDAAAAVSACLLLKKDNISAEISRIQNEQRAQSAAKYDVTKDTLLKNLAHIMNKQMDVFPPSALRAIEIIAKMQGLNEPDKLDITQDLNLIIPGVNDEPEPEDEIENDDE